MALEESAVVSIGRTQFQQTLTLLILCLERLSFRGGSKAGSARRKDEKRASKVRMVRYRRDQGICKHCMHAVTMYLQ